MKNALNEVRDIMDFMIKIKKINFSMELYGFQDNFLVDFDK